MTDDVFLNSGFGLLGALLSWFFGELDGVVKLLIALAVIDQITGLIKAGVLKEWNSAAGFNGLARKVIMFLLVGIANVIDQEFHTEVLRDGVSFFYVANEGLSIMENSIEMGIPFPDVLKERFLVWRKQKMISHINLKIRKIKNADQNKN